MIGLRKAAERLGDKYVDRSQTTGALGILMEAVAAFFFQPALNLFRNHRLAGPANLVDYLFRRVTEAITEGPRRILFFQAHPDLQGDPVKGVGAVAGEVNDVAFRIPAETIGPLGQIRQEIWLK